MADLLLYCATGAFVLLFGFFVHHAHGTRQLMERMRIEERQDMQRLNQLTEDVRNQMAPGTSSTMCMSCSVGTAKPPSQYCDACREMMPKLKPKPAEPTTQGTGGPTTPTGVRS